MVQLNSNLMHLHRSRVGKPQVNLQNLFNRAQVTVNVLTRDSKYLLGVCYSANLDTSHSVFKIITVHHYTVTDA